MCTAESHSGMRAYTLIVGLTLELISFLLNFEVLCGFLFFTLPI